MYLITENEYKYIRKNVRLYEGEKRLELDEYYRVIARAKVNGTTYYFLRNFIKAYKELVKVEKRLPRLTRKSDVFYFAGIVPDIEYIYCFTSGNDDIFEYADSRCHYIRTCKNHVNSSECNYYIMRGNKDIIDEVERTVYG